MAKTKKRVTVALTKEDCRQIEALCELFGENRSNIFQRGLILLYYITFNLQGSELYGSTPIQPDSIL